MHLGIDIEGSLQRMLDSRIEPVKRGATEGMRSTAQLAKERLRRDVRTGGFENSRKLANSWRAETFPKKGKSSLRTASFIYSNAPHIIAAHEEGATIRPVNGSKYLWIPTENVPRQGRGGKLMPPWTVEEKFGDFEYVPGNRAGRFLAIVSAVRRVTKSGKRGVRRYTAGRKKRKDKQEDIHMYTLVPMVRLPKRLKGRSIRDDIAMRVMPRLVAQSIAAELAADRRR